MVERVHFTEGPETACEHPDSVVVAEPNATIAQQAERIRVLEERNATLTEALDAVEAQPSEADRVAQLERERDAARHTALAANCVGPWAWMPGGTDGENDLASMSAEMVVQMTAGVLRALLSSRSAERLMAIKSGERAGSALEHVTEEERAQFAACFVCGTYDMDTAGLVVTIDELRGKHVQIEHELAEARDARTGYHDEANYLRDELRAAIGRTDTLLNRHEALRARVRAAITKAQFHAHDDRCLGRPRLECAEHHVHDTSCLVQRNICGRAETREDVRDLLALARDPSEVVGFLDLTDKDAPDEEPAAATAEPDLARELEAKVHAFEIACEAASLWARHARTLAERVTAAEHGNGLKRNGPTIRMLAKRDEIAKILEPYATVDALAGTEPTPEEAARIDAEARADIAERVKAYRALPSIRFYEQRLDKRAAAEPVIAEPRPGAPMHPGELPDDWDRDRAARGKPDTSRNGAELRLAWAHYAPRVQALCDAIDAHGAFSPKLSRVGEARAALLTEHAREDGGGDGDE